MGTKTVLKMAICAGVISLAGCTHFLAERMVAPPNGGREEMATSIAREMGKEERATQIDIVVGPPRATVATWVYASQGQSRGTVLVLHGILASHSWVRQAAQALQQAGYCAVVIDLRGHGLSTGEHITYGVVESRDLAQVTDYLQAHHLAGKTIGVYGCSYGAATAIEFAGNDARVGAVVAVASFATLREEAPHFGRTLVPVPGAFLSDADYGEIIAEAGRIAEFDPAIASPLLAIAKTKAHVLLIHGNLDAITPASNSQRLHDAAPGTSELRVMKGQGHMSLALELVPEVRRLTCEWFERHLKAVDVVVMR